MPELQIGRSAARQQCIARSYAPAARGTLQLRHNALKVLFKVGRTASSNQAASLRPCSSQHAGTSLYSHQSHAYGAHHGNHRQLSPVKVFRSASFYDLDDYEWDDKQTAGTNTAHTSTRGLLSSSGSSYSHQPSNHHQQQQHQAEMQADDFAGDGIVGLFVSGWMMLIALLLKLLQPVASLLRFATRPLWRLNLALARQSMKRLAAELPEGWWAKLNFMWEQPVVKSIRITLSVANWSVRLPVLLTVLLTQGSLLASQVSLPMLAPLLLGTGMMMNSIKANASYIIPRLGLLVVLLWMLWFVNSVIQTTWIVLRNQDRIDARTMSGARMITECTSLLLAGIVVLSMLGINVNALLLPTGVVLAIASKDLLQNLIAGFYLVLVQPFRLGDKVAVTCSLPTNNTSSTAATPTQQHSSSSSTAGGVGVVAGWFEGVCEKVDLRYTVLRAGRRRLMVPNTAFVSREFLVYDDGVPDTHGRGYSSSSSADNDGSWQATKQQQQQREDKGGSTSSSANRSGASPDPFIREGHMTTEIPPLSAPIFPGVWTPPVGYPQYAHHPQQYAAHPAYYTAQPLQTHDQQQEQQHAEHQEQHDTLQQQQQDSTSQQQQRPSSPSGRGPPGYMPQGFNAPGLRYVGIPVYYGLPGMLGSWGEGTAAGTQQQQRQTSQQQQQQRYYEAPGMHQPVPPYQPEGLHPQAGTWTQQAQQQQPSQQQHQRHYEASGMHQPVPPYQPEGLHTRTEACAQRAQQQQQQKGPHHQQQHHQQGLVWQHHGGTDRVHDSSDIKRPERMLQQQQDDSRQRWDDGAAPSGVSASTAQQQHAAASLGIQQQAAHAAALGSVAGYGYWSYDGLHLGTPIPPMQYHATPPQAGGSSGSNRVTVAQHQSPSPDGIRPPVQPPAAAGTATAATASEAAESSVAADSAEAGEASVAAGFAGIAVLPVTGVVSAAAAAAAQYPGPADAAAVAEASAQIVSAGEQAVQVVQPLLEVWHDLGLEQL